jgi:putative FmdB family regulatory protein
MPTYEYRCAMGHTFEEFQSILADPIEHCPICGAKAERQISASGLIFKGTGFYITDYGRKNASAPATAKPISADKPAAEKPSDASSSSTKKEDKA